MRIVNQERTLSIGIDEIAVVVNDEMIIGELLHKDLTIVLGKYDSVKRARGVFKNMHRWYSNEITHTLNYFSEEDLNELAKSLNSNSLSQASVVNESMISVVDSHNDIYYMPTE